MPDGYGTPATVDGQVVRISDEVANINHDIGDAIRAGIISEEELPPEVTQTLGSRHSQRIDTLVKDIVEYSWPATGESEGPARIGMSEDVLAAANILREFMFQRVYLWEGRREEAERAKRVVRFLFQHYLSRPEEIDSGFVIGSDPPWRRVADYVAGMTDGFALSAAERLGHRT